MPELATEIQTSEKESEEVYLVWKSPSRPFKRRDAAWFKRAGSLLLILCLLFIFFKQFLLVAVFLALAFIGYVLVTVEPEEIEHKISSQGVTTGGRSYLWDELDTFYFTTRLGQDILSIKTKVKFPGVLMILLDGCDKESVKNLLIKKIPFREAVPIPFVDKVTDSLAKFFSLD